MAFREAAHELLRPGGKRLEVVAVPRQSRENAAGLGWLVEVRKFLHGTLGRRFRNEFHCGTRFRFLPRLLHGCG